MSEDFTITSEEADQLKEALKKEEFRELLKEYAEEISNPENLKRYEEEIRELEKQRGVDAKFINPEPGFVLKAREVSTNKKVFVNICQSENVQPATVTNTVHQKKKKGQQWSIPYSLAPPREDLDKAKKKCRVFDVVFHPQTYRKGREIPQFRELLVSTALDGLERQFSVIVDRQSVKRLKMKFKGVPTPTVIRTKTKEPPTPDITDRQDPLKVPYPPLHRPGQNALGNQTSRQAKRPDQRQKAAKEPRYTVVHRGHFDMAEMLESRERHCVKRPKELVVTVDLPKMESAGGMDLDIFEKRILLQSQDYRLDLALSYPIDEDKCLAQFNKHSRSLTIVLPVLPKVSSGDAAASVSLESLPSVEDETPQTAMLETEDLLDSETLESSPENCASVAGTVCANSDSSHDSVSSQVRSDWSVQDMWICPPFSFEQSEDHMTIILHVPHVKNTTMTSLLEKNTCLLTFRGAASAGCAVDATSQSYSFCAEFVDDCRVDPDNSKIDVSEENVVIVFEKERKGLWERFMAGLSSSQMQEKLFLTERNVVSAISHPYNGPWSSSPDGKTSSSNGGEARVEVVSSDKSGVEIQLTIPDLQDAAISKEIIDNCDEVQPQVERSLVCNEKDSVSQLEPKERKKCDKRVHWNLPVEDVTSDNEDLEVKTPYSNGDGDSTSQMVVSDNTQAAADITYKDELFLKSTKDSTSNNSSRSVDLNLSNTLLFDLD